MYDNYQFAIYNLNCDTVEVNIANNMVLVIPCSAYNTAVIFDNANDIVYLYRLAKETPFTYAKLAMQKNGLPRLRRCHNLSQLTFLTPTFNLFSKDIFYCRVKEIN